MTRLEDVSAIVDLAEDAEQDGHRMVTKLIVDWEIGANRFEAPGESLYIATIGARSVGVCDLNVDPYVTDPRVGRVRRLYVSRSHRRHGVGSILVDKVIDDARRSFDRLRLRTHNPIAAAFYSARGFSHVDGDETCTHERGWT